MSTPSDSRAPSGAPTDCPRAKSAVTPCVIRDGDDARADDGVCVGCGVDVPRVASGAPTTTPRDIDRDITAVIERYAAAVMAKLGDGYDSLEHAHAAAKLDDYLEDLTRARRLRDRLLHAACEAIEGAWMRSGAAAENAALQKAEADYPECVAELREFVIVLDSAKVPHV